MENQNQNQQAQNVKVTMPTGSLRKTIARSAEGYPLLGNCVYWSFSEIKVSYDAFIKMLSECGIDEKVARKTRDKSAITKALKASVKDSKQKFHRKVVDDAQVAAFAIVNSQVDAGNMDVNFETETKVSYDKQNSKLVISGSPEVERKISDLYKDYQESYMGDQIRSAVLRYIYDYCAGISVRDNGGIYFIPSNKLAEYEKLCALFDKLNAHASCSIDTMPVIDTSLASKSMWKAFVSEVMSEISDIEKDIKDIDKDLQQRAQDRRFDRFKNLQTKVEMYEILLNGTANDLKDKMKAVEQEFRRKLVG